MAFAQWQDTATEAGFTLGWKVIARLPESTARALFNAAADQMWRRQGPSVQQLEKNLRRVRPEFTHQEIRELSRASLRSYLRYWCEAFRLPRWSRERIETSFKIENSEPLFAAMAAGHGAIMVLGHSGNWDLAGAWGCTKFGSLTSVAERLKPEGLFEQFLAFRESLGMEILAHRDPDVLRTLARRLKEGGLVALVGDRDLSANGVPVTFFGEQTSMPAGPAMLSLMTGAPLHPVVLWYSDGAAHGKVLDRVLPPEHGDRNDKIAAMTQAVASALETGVDEHPADWHMLQPFWWADDRRRQ